MLLHSDPPFHLTYCLNVHPGETWGENFVALQEKALAVRDAVSPGKPFGLGLRLSAAAAQELVDGATRGAFKEFLARENLYVFTINGFPYGNFHGERVKEEVYAPDWRTAERCDYSVLLADLLADLLPDGLEGSISTVPGSFKKWIESGEDLEAMVVHLVEVAAHLHGIRESTGKEIHIGLEPEPSCFLETTDETIAFLNDRVFGPGAEMLSEAILIPLKESGAILRRHLGVCFDTCHVALQFEDLVEAVAAYEQAGIRISKCQISAALAAPAGDAEWEALQSFDEPVYLHQVKVQTEAGDVRSWDDLPEALAEKPEGREVRVHFHVPLFLETYGILRSTAGVLTPAFAEAMKASGCRHYEIETYTFDVLPEELRNGGVVDCITREIGYARDLFGLQNTPLS